MRKIVIAVLCVGLSTAASGQALTASSTTSKTTVNPAKKFQSLVGLWEIVGEQESEGYLEVVDSSTILLRYMGEEKKLTTHRIDFSKSPSWFDFDAKDSGSVVTIKSIFEFINDDMVKWQVFMDEERTSHFSSTKGELMYLRRAKGKSNAALYTGNR